MDGEDRIFLEADSRPVRKYLNSLLQLVLSREIDELTIQSVDGGLKVEGDLEELIPARSEFSRGVVCRLKIMANMDVSEILLVQTGKIELTIDNKPVTFAVRTIPDFFRGERVVVTLA